jgi:hypothetical protein
MARQQYPGWFQLALDSFTPERVADSIGKLNLNGIRLGNWAQFPSIPKGIVVVQQQLTYAATLTWTPAVDGCNAHLILTGGVALSIDTRTLDTGTVLTLVIEQNGTGGWATTWGGSNISWGMVGVPTLDTTLSTKSIVTFYWDGTSLDGALFGTQF